MRLIACNILIRVCGIEDFFIRLITQFDPVLLRALWLFRCLNLGSIYACCTFSTLYDRLLISLGVCRRIRRKHGKRKDESHNYGNKEPASLCATVLVCPTYHVKLLLLYEPTL